MNCLLWKGSERASVCFFLQAVCDEGIARLFGGKWMQKGSISFECCTC